MIDQVPTFTPQPDWTYSHELACGHIKNWDEPPTFSATPFGAVHECRHGCGWQQVVRAWWPATPESVPTIPGANL